ncbi:MAG: RsmE family RNA methyltransferase, partial [Candidatus Omnitrophica bacterium]|nr:RsmE family RNA methyltransferase [Candidatus Omnitrophota bacterium]
MRRSFISPDAIHGDEVRVTDRRELHHLRDVLRVSAGERLLFFDGSGQTWVGEVTGLSSTALTARVQSAAPTHAPGLAMTLVQAIPKHDRLDAIVEHASALGVARIIPVISARTIARPAGPRAEAKRSRW